MFRPLQGSVMLAARYTWQPVLSVALLIEHQLHGIAAVTSSPGPGAFQFGQLGIQRKMGIGTAHVADQQGLFEFPNHTHVLFAPALWSRICWLARLLPGGVICRA